MFVRTLMLAFLSTTAAALPAGAQQAAAAAPLAGAVFAATNDAARNEILMFARSADGRLLPPLRFATGGRGQGGVNDPLGSNYSVLLSPDHRFLFAVNAGTSDISVFRVFPRGLLLVGLAPSGGGNPVALALHGNLLYALNAGGDLHTQGFRVLPSGSLSPIPNSRQPLNSPTAVPAAAVFSPDGSRLIISDRASNTLDVFSVLADGTLANPVYTNSRGIAPFGMLFAPSSSALLVTEANPTGLGSTSAYTLNPDNTLTTITDEASSNGSANCWIATNGRYAWVTNTGSSSVGYYSVGNTGALTPLGIAASLPTAGPVIFPPVPVPTSYPLDVVLSADAKYAYVLYSVNAALIAYRIEPNGTLTEIGSQSTGAPQIGMEGVAAY